MEKCFGPLIIDINGKELSPEDRELLAHPLVGGVIFFSKNFESPQQIAVLSASIRQSQKKPFLIMVDQEGGRVQRFKQGFTLLPPVARYAEAAESDPALGLALAKAGGYVMASEILSKNIDLSLAPVLDLNNPISTIIGDRAFHQKPKQVIEFAAAFIQGMKEAGMAATGKHFPGHGSIAPDSHKELPVDTRGFAEIEQNDLQPFSYFIQDKIPALMTAHILFPEVDALPVTFSRHWLQEILRKRLGYQGVVMGDDLDMKGAAIIGDYADRARAACDAGCDIIMLSHNRPALLQILDGLPQEKYLLPLSKYELLKGDFTKSRQANAAQLFQDRSELLQKHCELA